MLGTWLLLLVLACHHSSFGQCCPYFDELSIIPENPTTADSIQFVSLIVTPQLGRQLHSSFSYTKNGTFKLEKCFWWNTWEALDYFKDTFSIGQLEAGNYTIKVAAFKAHSIDSCFQEPTNDTIFSFYVASVNSIQAFNKTEEVGLFPNPVIGEYIHIQKNVEFDQLICMDAMGRIVKSLATGRKNDTEFNVSDLRPGMYSILLLSQNNIVSKQKFIIP